MNQTDLDEISVEHVFATYIDRVEEKFPLYPFVPAPNSKSYVVDQLKLCFFRLRCRHKKTKKQTKSFVAILVLSINKTFVFFRLIGHPPLVGQFELQTVAILVLSINKTFVFFHPLIVAIINSQLYFPRLRLFNLSNRREWWSAKIHIFLNPTLSLFTEQTEGKSAK